MTDAERIEVLALAYALLDGSPWWRGDGTAFIGGVPAAAPQCAQTAFNGAFQERSPRGIDYRPGSDYEQLRRLVESGVPGEGRLSDYNDAPGRRKRDVLRLYEKAAAKLGK